MNNFTLSTSKNDKLSKNNYPRKQVLERIFNYSKALQVEYVQNFGKLIFANN